MNLRAICNELGSIEHKSFKIGIQLGIPRNKLMAFEKERDPLSAAVDFWLSGNVSDTSSPPISWTSIVTALKSPHVDEGGLADTISKKYCQEENQQIHPVATRSQQQASSYLDL